MLRYDQFDLISKGLTLSVHHPSLIEVEAGDRIYVTPNRIDHDTLHGIITVHAQYLANLGPAPSYETFVI